MTIRICITLLGFLLYACAEDSAQDDVLAPELLEALHSGCVAFVNEKRGGMNLTALERWTAGEACSDAQASTDMQDAGAHGSFGSCAEKAQNTCPGWPTDTSTAAHLETLRSCLQTMWDEGPGEPYSEHGHYLNMSSTDYSALACGVATSAGKLWVNVNFR